MPTPHSPALASLPLLKYRTQDLLAAATIAVAFGVVFRLYGELYSVLAPWYLLHPPTIGLLIGFWSLPALVAGFIIRRPGAALFTELVAASIEALLGGQWGVGTLIGGFNAGIGIEIALLIFMYRKYTLPVAILGGFLHTIPEWFYKLTVAYGEWSWPHKVELFGFYAISGVIMTGIGGYYLVRALADTGALNMFPAGRERMLSRLPDQQ
ncbi:ECF transporter S component [Dermabacteraceae bacterium P7074]